MYNYFIYTVYQAKRALALETMSSAIDIADVAAGEGALRTLRMSGFSFLTTPLVTGMFFDIGVIASDWAFMEAGTVTRGRQNYMARSLHRPPFSRTPTPITPVKLTSISFSVRVGKIFCASRKNAFLLRSM